MLESSEDFYRNHPALPHRLRCRPLNEIKTFLTHLDTQNLQINTFGSEQFSIKKLITRYTRHQVLCEAVSILSVEPQESVWTEIHRIFGNARRRAWVVCEDWVATSLAQFISVARPTLSHNLVSDLELLEVFTNNQVSAQAHLLGSTERLFVFFGYGKSPHRGTGMALTNLLLSPTAREREIYVFSNSKPGQLIEYGQGVLSIAAAKISKDEALYPEFVIPSGWKTAKNG